jgi:glycosyltransferase involved in cell wall biosynthesis
MLRFGLRRPCKLTVITPTFNRADFLKETIDSVQSQGFADLQHIVIDDGSTDDTKALVQTYGRRIEYHWHSNVGEQKTVNRALHLVRGEFFMIVNSDDPILPNCLARMVGALRDDETALAAYPDWQVIGADPRPIATIHLPTFDAERLATSPDVSIGPGACFRRSVLELVGYRNPLLRYSADLDYWYRIALAGKIVRVAEPLATHRTHSGSASVAERGELLARETSYLFEAYSRHPRMPRWTRGVADANGHFAAIFVCTTVRRAAREILRGFSANPLAFLKCIDHHSVAATIDFLQELGGVASVGTAEALDRIATVRCRAAAYQVVARAGLRDPMGWLQAIEAFGLPRLMSRIRQFPLYCQ